MGRSSGWVLGGTLAAAATVCVGLSVRWYGTAGAEPAPAGPSPAESAPADPPKKTEFAEDTVPKNPPAADLKFDPERALKYLKQLCDLGPRVSGTAGMQKLVELTEKHFKDHGATVTRQVFKARQVSRPADTEMTNLIVSWHPDRARRVLVSSHYDTRPIADQETNRGNWNKPFLSANDGTSGVAWMMEMAHHMKGLKTEIGVDFVLFDGEEYVFETNRIGGGDRYFFGSEHFAAEYTKTKAARKYEYAGGVLLDLFAGKGAALKVESYSWRYAPRLVEQIWGTAKAVGATSFKAEAGYEVQDDHLALNGAGIPTVDIIDFDYPHWHKLTDTPDKVSEEQMAEVAKVLATWISSAK